jgi:hypothetical protein
MSVLLGVQMFQKNMLHLSFTPTLDIMSKTRNIDCNAYVFIIKLYKYTSENTTSHSQVK